MAACPTPLKYRFATREAATCAEPGLRVRMGQPLNAYWCGCGWWHLTKRQPRPQATPIPPTDWRRAR